MPELRKALGLPALVFYGVGVILGAGIYAIVGPAAGEAGEALWVSFVLGAVVAALTGLSYAELATAIPRAGAEYHYLARAFPRHKGAAATVGLVLAFATFGTSATVALAFAGYLGTFASFAALPAPLAAAGLLASLTALNVLGIKEAGWVNAAFTLLEVAGLLMVIAAGALAPGFGMAFLAAPGPGVLAGAALVFFAFLGFEDLANLAEEARHPARDMPRALLLVIGTTTLLYVLVAAAVVALAPPAALARSEAPLADAVAAVSPALAGALGGIALFATANTGLVALVVGSRMLFGLARAGELPGPLASVLSSRGTPWLAALVALAAAVALVLALPDVATLGGIASFAALVAFASVNLAVLALRRRDPRMPRPFRVPLAVRGLPLPAMMGLASAALLATQFEGRVLLVGGAATGAAAAVVLGYRRARGRRRRS